LQWVLADLIFLCEADVFIDRQTLDEVLEYENRNYSLFDCTVCAHRLWVSMQTLANGLQFSGSLIGTGES